jgi:NADH:ubiquinone oxidoreductase subunit E
MGRERGRLIPMLQRVQEALTRLPPAAIELVAEHLQISAASGGNSANSRGLRLS